MKNENVFILKILIITLAFDVIINNVSGYLIGEGSARDYVLLLYFSMVGSVLFLFPLHFLSILKKNNDCNAESKDFEILIVFTYVALFYFLAWFIFGAILGQHVKDVVGATIRAIIPFAVISFVYRLCIGCDNNNFLIMIKNFVKIKIIGAVLGAVVKLFLVLQGLLYGGGANQYNIGTFVFVWTLIAYFKSSNRNFLFKLYVFVVFPILIILSTISLKRGIWVLILFNFLIIFSALSVSKKIKFAICLVCIMSISVCADYTYTNYYLKIINRIANTISMNGYKIEIVDKSSNRRLEEVYAAFYTLNSSFYYIGWISGMGPGSGYLNPQNIDFKNLNERGQPYHIHSFYGIIILRFGIIGVFLYLIPFVFMLSYCIIFFKKIKKMKKSETIFDPLIVGFACICDNLAIFLMMNNSNSFYGNLAYGFNILIFCICLKMINNKL